MSDQWRNMWRLKEKTMRFRNVKTIETLKEHSRSLPPLNIGDNVFVQNQSGNSPGQWDCSGVIVESKGHDQYAVKVAGTSRLTLRNRRFYRVFTPRFAQGPVWRFERSISPTNDKRHTLPPTHQFTSPGSVDPTPVIQKPTGDGKTISTDSGSTRSATSSSTQPPSSRSSRPATTSHWLDQLF